MGGGSGGTSWPHGTWGRRGGPGVSYGTPGRVAALLPDVQTSGL